jgi:hypothetical protein
LLADAQRAARAAILTADRDVPVILHNGRYELAEPLRFTPADSGRNGHRVSYQGDAGRAVLSGGRVVTGWKRRDAATGVHAADVSHLFRSGVIGPQRIPRSLWVDGSRAVRARTKLNPAGFVREAPPTGRGFVINPAVFPVQKLQGAPQLEVVMNRAWKNYRCPVVAVVNNRMQVEEPCWTNVHVHFPPRELSWIENGPGLLDEPGEWYLDPVAQELLYLPRQGRTRLRSRSSCRSWTGSSSTGGPGGSRQ